MNCISFSLPKCDVCDDFIGEDFENVNNRFICSGKCRNVFIDKLAIQYADDAYKDVLNVKDLTLEQRFLCEVYH